MQNKEKNFVSAVVYVHNAEQTIGNFLEAVAGVLETHFEQSEIICVNDESRDASKDVIKEVSKNFRSTVSVVNMSAFHGLELSMNAGVDLSIGDFVFEFDVPVLDFDPQVILDVYHRSLEGYDIVSAVPDRKEKLFSRLFYRIFDKTAHLRTKMHTESFRILSRRVINRISSMNRTVPYRKAIYAMQGLKTDQLKYHAADVKIKYDKEVRGYRSGLAMDCLILFTEVGYRFSMVMTVFMMLMSIFMAVYTLVIYLTSNPVAGWTTTILFFSVAFFGLFAILTVIIKYLQIIMGLVFKRKHYSFESIEKLTK